MQVDIAAPNCALIMLDGDGEFLTAVLPFSLHPGAELAGTLQGSTPRELLLILRYQMHYNEGADLLTYLVDPSVFAIKDGYVEALQSEQVPQSRRLCMLNALRRPRTGHRDQ